MASCLAGRPSSRLTIPQAVMSSRTITGRMKFVDRRPVFSQSEPKKFVQTSEI
jgi:hypothetical protein